MTHVNVRYIVLDVDEALAFYTQYLGFQVEMHPGRGFARLSRGDLRRLLSTLGGSGGAAQTMPDGRRPEPGAGIASKLRWTTSQVSLTHSARVEHISATTS